MNSTEVKLENLFTFSNKIKEQGDGQWNFRNYGKKINTVKCRMCVWWNLLTLEWLEEKIRINDVNIAVIS